MKKIYHGHGIYQGDIMFTSSMKKKETINGVPSLTYTPNTITYTVPEASKDLYKAIDAAEVGIVIHTRYSGTTLQDMSSTFDVDMKQFKKASSVWYSDAFINNFAGNVLLTPSDSKKLKDIISSISSNKSKVKKIISKMTDLKMLPILKIIK